ncbi:hypothetical protein AB0B85_04375 [Micromonospora sp. NPDC049044]|uniref:hypothetical protein n=2 Tax=unclassified Micromonospora TaxID=2617518 RepID=UPI0033E540BD
MAAPADGRSLFLGLIGAPYESDLFTTAVRMAEEAVRQGHQTTLWTCGYSTALTVTGLAPTKPRNLTEWDRDYPSSAALATHLIDWSAGRLAWLVCRYCAEERGASAQIPAVRIRPPYEFVERSRAADVSLVLGTK